MKAIVIHAEKDLRIEDRDEGAPSTGEVAVRIATAGICGSDLHYYNHAGFGNVRLKEPMILGHEVAGHIIALGDGVTGLDIGERVAVSPSRPCGHCDYCRKGLPNHCENMRFYGSAMPFPHIQGAFQQILNVRAEQCVKAGDLSTGEAAMAEPLSVALHATRRAGEMLGKRVLVTGAGPIGVLCAVASRAAGAAEITITDLADNPLTIAKRAGADRSINVGTEPDALAPFKAGKGTFDVLYECTGSAVALADAIGAMAPRSVALQLGLGGDMNVPVQAITAKEIDFRGSFRFHEEFAMAVKLMQKGIIDVKPLISQTLDFADAKAAFDLASDRTRAMKVQLAFG